MVIVRLLLFAALVSLALCDGLQHYTSSSSTGGLKCFRGWTGENSGGSCHFDGTDFCDWSNAQNDTAEWNPSDGGSVKYHPGYWSSTEKAGLKSPQMCEDPGIDLCLDIRFRVTSGGGTGLDVEVCGRSNCSSLYNATFTEEIPWRSLALPFKSLGEFEILILGIKHEFKRFGAAHLPLDYIKYKNTSCEGETTSAVSPSTERTDLHIDTLPSESSSSDFQSRDNDSSPDRTRTSTLRTEPTTPTSAPGSRESKPDTPATVPNERRKVTTTPSTDAGGPRILPSKRKTDISTTQTTNGSPQIHTDSGAKTGISTPPTSAGSPRILPYTPQTRNDTPKILTGPGAKTGIATPRNETISTKFPTSSRTETDAPETGTDRNLSPALQTDIPQCETGTANTQAPEDDVTIDQTSAVDERGGTPPEPTSTDCAVATTDPETNEPDGLPGEGGANNVAVPVAVSLSLLVVVVALAVVVCLRRRRRRLPSWIRWSSREHGDGLTMLITPQSQSPDSSEFTMTEAAAV